MIICQLMGGMGNQMFQYAFSLTLSNKYNIPFCVDLSYLKRRDFGPLFVYRDYDLDIFDINPDFSVPNIDLQIDEFCFEYSPELLKHIGSNLDKNILLTGQFQTDKYFNEELVRSELKFKDKIEDSDIYHLTLLDRIKNSNSVMVNIRRTDFLNGDFHGVFGMDYINSAREIIESSVLNPHYFVFSDDIDWCHQNIFLPNMTIVNHSFKGNKFSYYLQLMSNCKHFIIPNSSFAWWAAWLNQNPDKIVISPKRWFNRDEVNTSDLIPEKWLRI